MIFRSPKVLRIEDSDINLSPSSIHTGYCKSSSYQVVTESIEEWPTFDLREILSTYIVNQLCILWKESRNPVVWLAKLFIVFIFISDSWRKKITA